MLDCKKCGVRLTGRPERCPLCHGELFGEPEGENIFPDISYEKMEQRFLVRLLAFGTVIVIVLCAAVNYVVPEYGWWFMFVVAGLLSVWIAAANTVKKRGNLLKSVLWQVCVDSVLLVLWDFGMGFLKWSVDFVLPVLYICSIIAMFVIAFCKHIQPQDYLLYLVLDILIGLIPAILLLTEVVQVIYPSVVCVVVSVVAMAALILFNGQALKNELIRRLHL